MEKKTHKLVNRAEFIQSYLKNPYNLTPQSTEANTIYYNSLPSPKSHTRFLRKVLSPSKHKPTLPELNGNNAFYLSKTSLAFRKTREEWQSQLNFCLQSKSIRGAPASKLLIKPSQTPSMHIMRRPNPRMVEPLLEIQVQKLF